MLEIAEEAFEGLLILSMALPLAEVADASRAPDLDRPVAAGLHHAVVDACGKEDVLAGGAFVSLTESRGPTPEII